MDGKVAQAVPRLPEVDASGSGARPEVVRYQVEPMDGKVAQAVPRLPGVDAAGSGTPGGRALVCPAWA